MHRENFTCSRRLFIPGPESQPYKLIRAASQVLQQGGSQSTAQGKETGAQQGYMTFSFEDRHRRNPQGILKPYNIKNDVNIAEENYPIPVAAFALIFQRISR